jgi:serine protease Do
MQIRKPFVLIAALVIACGASGAAGGIFAEHLRHNQQGANTISEVTTGGNATLSSKSSDFSIPSIVSKVSPAVVDITTQSTTFSFFGGPQTQQGAGTGMILTSSGYILTNNHVLPVNGGTINVTLQSGKQYNARVVTANTSQDLALLKINGNGLPTVTLGDSGQEQVGSSVIAIGNALGQFQNSVVTGIISGTNRSVQASDQGSASSESLTGLFQTDAAINPGDSGGPLIDLATGGVIGIDTAVARDGQGIGFAIPISVAKSFITPYVNNGQV